jgi:hypothetical protein
LHHFDPGFFGTAAHQMSAGIPTTERDGGLLRRRYRAYHRQADIVD